jgi:hypothetical protein
MELDLRGVKSNRNAIGAEITVKAGDLLVYREVKGSEGFGATNPYRQHFGLGRHDRVDSVEIRWPSGERHTFAGIEANHILSLKEDEREYRLVK